MQPRRIDAALDIGLADTTHQNEGQGAAAHLLVLRHDIQKRVGRWHLSGDIPDMGRQSDGGKMRRHAGAVVDAAKAQRPGEVEGEPHADGNALAMHQPGAVIGDDGLQRVAERVAEIEQGPLAGLELVGRDNTRLGPAGGGNRLLALGAAGKDRAVVRLEPGEEGGIAKQAVFDDLRVAGAELARG